MRRRDEQLKRFRQLVPDWKDRLVQNDSDDPGMWSDEHGYDDETWYGGLGAGVEIEPVIEDGMDLSEQGSEHREESLEQDDDEDEDYDGDAERENSSDGSDGDSRDYLVPEAGWIVE